MKTAGKKLGLAVKAGAAALVLAGVAAAAVPYLLKRYLPPEKVRELIVAGARKSIRREVRLGEVSYSLLDGLSLKDFAVSEATDFSAGTFASARFLRVQIRWLPLLSRKVVLDSISAEGLKVNVVQLKPGVYNFSDIGGAPAAVPAGGASAAASGASFEVNIRKTGVADGEFSYKDQVSGDEWRLSGLQATIGKFRLNGPFDADVSVSVSGKTGGKPVAASLAYAGRLDLGGQDPKRFSASFKKLGVEYSGLKVQAAGSMEGLDAPKADLKFSLAAQGAAIVDGEYKGSVVLPQKGAALSAKGGVKLTTPGFAGAALTAYGVPKDAVCPALKASGSFDYSGDNVALAGFKLEGKAGAVELNGSVAGLKGAKPVPDLDVFARLDLPALHSNDYAWAKAPAGIDLPAGSLEGKIRLKGDSLAIANLHVQSKQGTGSVSGTVTGVSSGKPAWDLDFSADADLPALKAADVPWAKLPAGLELPAAKLATKGHAKGYDVRLDALHLQTKAGTIDASGAALKLSSAKPDFDFDLAAKLSLPEIRGKDYAWAKLAPEVDLPASSLEGKVHLAGDSARIAALRVKTDRGSGELSGTVGAIGSAQPTWDLDFSVAADVPALKASQAAWAKLPAGVETPEASVKAKGHAKGDGVTFESLHVQTKAGTIDVSGSASKLKSGKPDLDLDIAAKLDLPEIRSEDMAWAKLPAGYVSPAMGVDAKTHFKGDDLSISALHVKSKSGTVDVSGTVRKVVAGPIDPDLNVQAKVSLPALKTSDIPSQAVPAGLQLPASDWDADAELSLDEAKLRRLRLKIGKNDIEIADGKIGGIRSGTPLFAVLIKCRSFDLADLTQFTEQTRQAGLTGSGFFAMEIAGKWPKPMLSGKMKFSGLGGTAAGLKLSDFAGIASFDEKRIDIPDLKGKIADASLGMNLTVKDYTTAPKIDLEATLDRFDLGKFLAAKDAMTAPADSKSTTSADKSSKPAAPLDLSGKLAVGELVHPNVQAKGLEMRWDLTGYTPDYKKLDGTATFGVTGGGRFVNLMDMPTQSAVIKLGKSLVSVFATLHLFPHVDNVEYNDLAGEYSFASGLMTIKDSHINSTAGSGTAAGTANLPTQALNMVLTASLGKGVLAPIDVDVTGTIDKPAVKTHVLKAIGSSLVPGILKKAVEAVPTGAPVDNNQQ